MSLRAPREGRARREEGRERVRALERKERQAAPCVIYDTMRGRVATTYEVADWRAMLELAGTDVARAVIARMTPGEREALTARQQTCRRIHGTCSDRPRWCPRCLTDIARASRPLETGTPPSRSAAVQDDLSVLIAAARQGNTPKSTIVRPPRLAELLFARCNSFVVRRDRERR
jgi:hypothetical protein